MGQTYSSRLPRRLARPLAALGLLLATAGAAQAQTLAFAPVSAYGSGGPLPYGLATGDVNGDGRPDLVTLNSSSSTVAVLLGSSTAPGTFSAPTTYASGGTTNNAVSVALGDVNGDGRLDVVATNSGNNTVGVLLNSATSPGTFSPAVTYSTGGSNGPRVVALGDVNGDGRLDIATASFNEGSLSILLNSATAPGTFGTPALYNTGGTRTTGVALGDLNGDGQLDAVTLDFNNNRVSVFLNRASAPGTFGTPATYSNGITSPSSFGLTLGDLNGDARLDVVTANLNSPTVSVLLNSAATPGTLLAPTVYASGGTNPIELAINDLNGDGRADIAVSNYGSDNVGVLLNSAATPGTFAAASTFSTGANTAPRALVLADLNADGRRDIATANYGTGTVGVLLNTTLFAPAPTLATISPTSGPVGTSVTLTGQNLTGATAVRFNGTAATTFAVVNATTVTATVPTGATSGPVTVTTPSGTSGGLAFTVTAAAPVVTTPAAGSTTNGRPTFAGTAPAGSTVTLYLAMGSGAPQAIGTTTATGSSFSFVPSTALVSGTYSVYATAQSSGTGVSANSNTNTFTVDNTSPTATITTTASSITGVAPIPFTVTFSEPVMGFAIGDISVSNGTVTSTLTNTGNAYSFSVTPTAGGPVTVSIPANAAQDAVGNGNTAATSLSVQYLLTTPTPILVTPNLSLSQGSRPTFSGIAPAGSTVTLYVAAGSGPAQVIGTTIGTANDFYFFIPTVALAGGTYTTYVTAQLSGQAVSANSNTSTFTVDDTAPTAALTTTAGNATSASPIPFTVTFSEPVTGFGTSGISVSNGTVTSGLTAVGNAYSFGVTPTANGPVTVSVLANAAQDAAGNGSTASNSVSVQYTMPIPVPSITVFSPASGPVGTQVMLYGNNLGGVTAVSFNGTPASSFVVNSAGIITAVVPAGATTGPVRVTTPGGTATSPISFVVRTAPTTVADAYSTPQGITLTGNVLTNDLGTNPRAILITRPANGVLVLNPNGSFTYVPNAGFTGTDTFTYYACDQGTPLLCGNPATVTISVLRIAPVTVADSYSTPAGTTLTGNVLTNDLGTNPRAILINRPTNGTLVLNPNGSFSYVPRAGFSGTDSFTYYACDPAEPLLCGNPVTVTITVTRVAPITVADAYTTPQGVTLTGNVLTNDLGTNPRAILINRPTRGTLVLNPDGSFSYQPNAGFSGADSFTYYACNMGTPLVCGEPATVSLTVTPAQTATRPAAQAGNASPATSAKPAAPAVGGATIALELALTGHPNPFADELHLSFALPIAQAYTLALYDAQGRLVQQLASGQAEAGQARQLKVPTHTYAAGLYFVRLTTSTGTRQLKLSKQ